jgi:hypothetical protein
MSSNEKLYYPIEKVRSTFQKVSITSLFKVGFPLSNNSNLRGNGLIDWLSLAGIYDISQSEGLDPIEHIELLCSSAVLPGPSFKLSETYGNRQGVLEKYPLYKQFPEIALTFYVDSNHKIIKFFEEWTNYMNPLYNPYTGKVQTSNKGQNLADAAAENDYFKMRYPNQYTQNLFVTKFERDTYTAESNSLGVRYKNTPQFTYKFIKAYPNNIIPSPVTYNGSDILSYTVTFNYSRYVVMSRPIEYSKTLSIADATTL